MVHANLNKYLIMALLMPLFWNCIRPEKTEPVKSYFLGQETPGLTPVRFASDIINNNFFPHSKLIISPDNDNIYWTTFLDLESGDLALYSSLFDGELLSSAERDTLFDRYGIESFIFAKDGKSILFSSFQPYDGMNGNPVHAVWTSILTGSTLGKPQLIASTLDTNWAALGSVSINNAGDIFFVGRMEGESPKIYCTKFINGAYQKSEALPEKINTGATLDPFISPQGDYLLFSATGRDDNIGMTDLYISYKDEDGNWGEPSNLGTGISSQFIDRFPMVTDDGKFLFFVTSNSDHFPSTYTHYYWVDAKVIE